MLYSQSHTVRRLSLVARWTQRARSASEGSNRADVRPRKDWSMKLGNTSAHQSAGCILALIAFAFALPMGANAQWEVIYLNPPGATSSRAFGIGDAQQAGSAMVGGVAHAGLWSGSAKSWVDLHLPKWVAAFTPAYGTARPPRGWTCTPPGPMKARRP